MVITNGWKITNYLRRSEGAFVVSESGKLTVFCPSYSTRLIVLGNETLCLIHFIYAICFLPPIGWNDMSNGKLLIKKEKEGATTRAICSASSQFYRSSNLFSPARRVHERLDRAVVYLISSLIPYSNFPRSMLAYA